MASITEAQSAFYRSQQTKYQEIEPNRFLDDRIKGTLSVKNLSDMLGNFSRFDPYTGKKEDQLSASAMESLLQGQSDTTDQERLCRQYVGQQGLEQLIRDTTNQPNAPVRCGWRYKKSPDGIVPEISNGALGTRVGPLNTNSKEDQITSGIEWLWNLDNARLKILRDIAIKTPTPKALDILQSVGNGQFNGTLAWCAPLQKYIPVDSQGKPLDPRDTCAPNMLFTKSSDVPPEGNTTTSVSNLANQNIATLAACANPGTNTALSRDCLLLAIKNNGCSDKGTLYKSLELVNPNDTRWDSFIRAQSAFNTYQSTQGGNGITASLFERDRGTWETATRDVGRLSTYASVGADPSTRIAARDLCLAAGDFDTYDFCSDVTDGTLLGNVQSRCLQNYWQEMNGKPAGAAYPTTSGNLDPVLRNPRTWGAYKQSVQDLKNQTTNPNPTIQREAIRKFFGVPVSTSPFSPDYLSEPDRTQPCLGLGRPSADGAMRIYTENECRGGLKGVYNTTTRECAKPSGGSFSWDCRYLNGRNISNLALWVDAFTFNNMILDQNDRIRNIEDASPAGRLLFQPNGSLRPAYTTDGMLPDGKPRGAISFQRGNLIDIPNGYDIVRNNFTIFLVARRRGNFTAQENWMTFGNNNSQRNCLVLGVRNNNIATLAYWSNDLDTPPMSGGTQQSIGGDPIRIYAFTQNNSGRQIYINGRLAAVDGNTRRLLSWNGACLGGSFDGFMYEALFYNTDLNTNDRLKVEGYLAHKWGLAVDLDPVHPYRGSKP